MGTSSSFGGPKGKSALVPSWLNAEDPQGTTDAPAEPAEDSENTGSALNPQLDDPARFSPARRLMTRFVKSGGGTHAELNRAIGSYVAHALGGSQRAVRRMAVSRAAGALLLEALQAVALGSKDSVLGALAFDEIRNKSPDEALFLLMDSICPNDGSVDAGHTRDAFLECVNELLLLELNTLADLTLDQTILLVQNFIAKTIYNRILCDIGQSIIKIPKGLAAVKRIEKQVLDYVMGHVVDSTKHLSGPGSRIKPGESSRIVDSIYRSVFTVLQQTEW